MAIANQEMIRDNNRRQVLEYLVNHPPVSRAALSQQLHLTKATISNIVQELIEQHLILEIGSAHRFPAPFSCKSVPRHNR